ncbi:MAG TPA: helix-turn-helix transcriptional regulator [Terriglobales bacterium]|nr:helix-turn-helix transcriptional regulator [Terriglobales bacterium]
MPLTLAFDMARKPNQDSKAVSRSLGKRLSDFRKMRGYNQRELAQRVGVVQVVVSDYETGKLRLSAEMALRFAAALDVPIQKLLDTGKPLDVEPPRKQSRHVLRRLEQIERLPRRKQEALLTTIDAFLQNVDHRAS